MLEFFVHFFLHTMFFRSEKNEHLQNLSNYNLKFVISLLLLSGQNKKGAIFGHATRDN